MKPSLVTASLFLGVLAPAVSEAAPAELRAIVLTGTKLPARVGEGLEAVRAKLTGFVVAPGFPKVMESKAVEGLKPGFEVIVLGFCPIGAIEAGIADLVEQAAKDAVPGAYGRAVKGATASCPRLKITKPDDAEGAKLWAAVEKDPDAPDPQVALGHYLVGIGDLDGGEYLGLRALLKSPKSADAKGLLEKIGVLRTD